MCGAAELEGAAGRCSLLSPPAAADGEPRDTGGERGCGGPSARRQLPLPPQLTTLRLEAPSANLSVLRHFTAPPHARLRLVELHGAGFTAQHVLSLACLPRLCCLRSENCLYEDGNITELEEARRRMRLQLLSRDTAGCAERDAHRPTPCMKEWAGSEDKPPLGPQQLLETSQHVHVEVTASRCEQERNWLACAEGDDDTAREVFFAELRSILTASSSLCA